MSNKYALRNKSDLSRRDPRLGQALDDIERHLTDIAAKSGSSSGGSTSSSGTTVNSTVAVTSNENWAAPEIPSGTIDGVNKTFTLSRVPKGAIALINNNLWQRPDGVDYTLAGNTITYVTAPRAATATEAADWHYVDSYRY